MATAAEITKVRLYIDDTDSSDYDFTDPIVGDFVDENNSVWYAIKELLKILRIRLRKELLKKESTGTESSEIASMKERMDLLNNSIAEAEKEYADEQGTGTGCFINTVKPTIAGGDV